MPRKIRLDIFRKKVEPYPYTTQLGFDIISATKGSIFGEIFT